MNKLLICIVLLFLASNLKGQASSEDINKNNHVTTLFEYGEPLKSTDANFRNLFRNFPKLVTNANEGIKLLSYKYITAIKNQEQIKRYLKENIKVYMADGVISTALGGDSSRIESWYIKIKFPPAYEINKSINKAFIKDLQEKLRLLANYVHLGDEVYLLNFAANGTPYRFYMFANPKTKSLLKDGNFLAFEIPVYYADFHSKKNPDSKE